ncbi:MAG: hypothetical protein JWN49_34 [Parcubacteria group bacterium]|nr:hypothetical protein [Parcubacteria group bacterium]
MDTQLEEKKELYRDEFTRFDKAKVRDGIAFDRIVFVITTGSFALSITYVLGLTNRSVIHPYALFASWAFFLCSMASHASGYLVSVHTSDYVQSKLVEWRSRGFVGNHPSPDQLIKKARLDAWIMRSNYLAIFFLIIGVLFLIFFGGSNLITFGNTPT